MSEHTVIVASFGETSKAFEALSRLRAAGSDGRVGIRGAALVERDEYGRISVPEGIEDPDGGVATWGGGLAGLTIGILGGPVGMLFGWSTGMLVGGVYDLRRSSDSSQLLSEMSATVQPGGSAVVAELEEVAVEVVDGIMTELGGTVIRRSADQVLAELEAAEDAYEEARKAADKAARADKRAERKESFDKRRDALRERLGIGSS